MIARLVQEDAPEEIRQYPTGCSSGFVKTYEQCVMSVGGTAMMAGRKVSGCGACAAMPAFVRKALMGSNSKPTSRVELQPQRMIGATVEAPAHRQLLRNASRVLGRSHENATPRTRDAARRSRGRHVFRR
jgi:hypothetical protein